MEAPALDFGEAGAAEAFDSLLPPGEAAVVEAPALDFADFGEAAAALLPPGEAAAVEAPALDFGEAGAASATTPSAGSGGGTGGICPLEGLEAFSHIVIGICPLAASSSFSCCFCFFVLPTVFFGGGIRASPPSGAPLFLGSFPVADLSDADEAASSLVFSFSLSVALTAASPAIIIDS